MRRRDFIALLGGTAAAWPLLARAQQAATIWRIGFLAAGSRPVGLEASPYGGFIRGMRDLGYVKTADALSLTIPAALYIFADEVIE